MTTLLNALLFLTLVILIPKIGHIQYLYNLKPKTKSDYDLMSVKNILHLKAGYRTHFELEKTTLNSRYNKSSDNWVIGYERSLLQKKFHKEWWGFKTDTRIFELTSGKVESRMLLMHGRDLNDFIKMTSNHPFCNIYRSHYLNNRFLNGKIIRVTHLIFFVSFNFD